jgi:TPR repeat protein
MASAESCQIAETGLAFLFGIKCSKSKTKALQTVSQCHCMDCQAATFLIQNTMKKKRHREFSVQELEYAKLHASTSLYCKLLLAIIFLQKWCMLQAIPLLKELAEIGSAVACLFLARLPYQTLTLKEAEFYFKKAHDLGAYEATMILGMQAFNSHRTKDENAPAFAFFKMVEATGFPHALRRLADFYVEDASGPRDIEEGMRLYRFAADNGDVKAMCKLGKLFYDGKRIPKDESQAIKYFRIAAETGYPAAQFDLGMMYLEDEGVSENKAEALRLLKLATDQGHEWAKRQLAFHS